MASLYEEALSAAREEGPAAVREHSVSNHSALPDERTLQLLLLEGVFGTSFTDDSGRDVHILDFGNWNKSAGPDFLNARICINGVPQSGDIELDSTPEDWERHGHGSNPGLTALSCTSPARPAAGNGSPAMPGMNAFLWLSFPPLRWRGQEHPLPATPRYATAATPDCWHPWLRSFWKHSSNQRQPTGSGTSTAAMRNAPNTQERNRPF